MEPRALVPYRTSALTGAAWCLALCGKGRTIDVKGKNIQIRGTQVTYEMPRNYQLPIRSFTVSEQATFTGLHSFLLGLCGRYDRQDIYALRSGCKSGEIPHSITAVYASERDFGQKGVAPLLLYLKSHLVPINPSPFDFFVNGILREWAKTGITSYANEYQKLMMTVFAFCKIAPPESDGYFAEISYLVRGEHLLQKILKDPAKAEEFKRFSKRPFEITRSWRYIPFLHFLAHDRLAEGIRNKTKIRILDVGGGMYLKEHGSPAGRYLIKKLQEMFPDKNFELVVTDVHFPVEYADLQQRGTISFDKDRVFAPRSIAYVNHSITEGPYRGEDGKGFDLVICNRVLTQPHFENDPVARETASKNLRASLRDENSILFLDQGQSDWVEIWQQGQASGEEELRRTLLTRIDHWFLACNLYIATNPNLIMGDRAAKQLLSAFLAENVPVFDWATTAKYFKTLMDPDRRQAAILWRIIKPKTNAYQKITEKMKREELPDILMTLRANSPAFRNELKKIIDRIARPDSFDLKGSEELQKWLAQFGYELDLPTVFSTKIIYRNLDKKIPAAVGLFEGFFELGGHIESVKKIKETEKIRKYELVVSFYNSDHPGKKHKVQITYTKEPNYINVEQVD